MYGKEKIHTEQTFNGQQDLKSFENGPRQFHPVSYKDLFCITFTVRTDPKKGCAVHLKPS